MLGFTASLATFGRKKTSPVQERDATVAVHNHTLPLSRLSIYIQRNAENLARGTNFKLW